MHHTLFLRSFYEYFRKTLEYTKSVKFESDTEDVVTMSQRRSQKEIQIFCRFRETSYDGGFNNIRVSFLNETRVPLQREGGFIVLGRIGATIARSKVFEVTSGLSYVLPLVAVGCVVIGVCSYVYVNNVNILQLNSTSSLKALFSVFRSWLEYTQMKGYQLSKPVEEKARSRNAGYSKENSPHISISHRLSFPRSRYACSDDNSNSANRRNGFSRYSLTPVNSSFDSGSRLENPYGNRSKTQDSSSSFRDEKNNLSRLSPWSDSENSFRDSNRRMKTVQTLAGPLLSSTRLNRSNSFDLGLYVDAGSPGLATRVVQYAEDSGFVGSKVTHQSQYSGPGQFPRVHLSRSSSKLPVLSPRNSQKVARRSVNVRIISPEQHVSGSRLFLHSSRSSNLHSSPPQAQMDPSTKSLLETLREISRKRMHSQLDDDDDDDAKRQKKSELESSSTSTSLPNGAIIDNDLQSKRSREDSPKQVDNQTQRPIKRFRNNEILSSLSSSRKLLQAGGIKRKTHSLDWSRSSTPVFGKQFKTSELSPPTVSVSGHNNVSPTSVAIAKGISPNVSNEIETPKLPTHPKNKVYTSAEKPSVLPTGRKGSPEDTVLAKQMSISQPSKLKDSLDEENGPSEESACVLEDLRSLKDRYPESSQNKLVNMLSSLSEGEKVPLTRAAVEPTKFSGILSTTSSPVASLSTATCTTSVLPTISSSSAEATKLMSSGVSVSPPTQSFSGFGGSSNTSVTNHFSSSQPVPSVSLSEGMTRGNNPIAVVSSQASVDSSKSQLTNSQSPFNSVSVSNNTTSVQFGFGSTASPSTTIAPTSQDTPHTTTTGANFGFIPTSLQQTNGTGANTPSSSAPSTFGLSGNTATSKPSTASASGFGIANSVNFGSTTSGGFNFASPAITAQSTNSSAAASLFSVQQPTSSSSAADSSVVEGPSVFSSPTSAQHSQGTTITGSSFAPASTVHNTSGTGSVLFGSSSASSQPNKSFSFGSGNATSPAVQHTGSASSIFGSAVTSTPGQQTNTSAVSSVQNTAFGTAPSSQPPKQGGFSFGNPSTTSAKQAEGKTGGFAFGSPAFSASGTPQDQPKTFGFGTQSTPATVSFGTQQTPASIAFGTPQTLAGSSLGTPQTPASSSFGTQQTPASSSFGTQKTPASSSFGTQQTPASSSFGTQQTPASSSFGTQQTPAGSSFGTPQTPASNSFRIQQTSASSSFRTQQTPASNSFGTQQTPVCSSFGTQQTPASSSFGTQQTPASTSFGTQQPSSNSSASLFGAQGDNSSGMGGFSFLSKQNSAAPNSGAGTTSPFQLGQASATTTNQQNPAGGFKFGFASSSKPASTTSGSTSSGFGSMFSSSSANSVAPTGSQQIQFGSSTPADKPMFSFGSSNKPSSFGTIGAPATTAPQSNTGGFGSPFGSPAASAPSATESQQKSQGLFSFGSGPGFGAGNTSTNAFSFGSSAEKKEGGFAFGSTSQQPANSGGAFNFNTGSSATSPATQNFSSGGMFGAQQPQPTSTFSFGAGSSGSTGSGGFSFGAQNSSTPVFGTGPSPGVQNSSTPAFGGGLTAGASSSSAPGFGAGPSSSNPFQMASSSSGFGGAPMFSIGSGSTAPRATRSSGARTRRTK